MKEIRHIIKLILTTDLSNEEIGKLVGSSPYIVGRLRLKALTKKCDWQKIKAMNDIEFRELLLTKCPRFAKEVLPAHFFIRRPPKRRNTMLHEIWEEYRRAYLRDFREN